MRVWVVSALLVGCLAFWASKLLSRTKQLDEQAQDVLRSVMWGDTKLAFSKLSPTELQSSPMSPEDFGQIVGHVVKPAWQGAEGFHPDRTGHYLYANGGGAWIEVYNKHRVKKDMTLMLYPTEDKDVINLADLLESAWTYRYTNEHNVPSSYLVSLKARLEGIRADRAFLESHNCRGLTTIHPSSQLRFESFDAVEHRTTEKIRELEAKELARRQKSSVGASVNL